MYRGSFITILILAFCTFLFISSKNIYPDSYPILYKNRINDFYQSQLQLLSSIQTANLNDTKDLDKIVAQIHVSRKHMKGLDIWLRYLEPLAYKKINSPLPVEWETEVFEKFEKPYKRVGAGLTLAELYLEDKNLVKDTLVQLLTPSLLATKIYLQDSIQEELVSYHHFYLCNRLYLLNLAAIYTTAFECPDTTSVIPELRSMLKDVAGIYQAYNQSFSEKALDQNYLDLYQRTIDFALRQPIQYTRFDHFTFIKDYINPLFAANQSFIRDYKVSSHSNVDYALSKQANSIFSKNLYFGQNPKGIFLRVKDDAVLSEIDRVGKLLFYDPILSGNNQRSCVSCHQSENHFTDTSLRTSRQFDHRGFLSRNTPSLLNVGANHLIMMDGKHISLQHQTKAVITNPVEMGSSEQEVLKKVLSCNEYKRIFTRLLAHTPQEKKITFDHIASAITFYYSKFSNYEAPFDEAMNQNKPLHPSVVIGFNLFMGKAQCATCHFAPQFNGVKPPYVGSEFEVLGVPADPDYRALSADVGRHQINEAFETHRAFRTGTLRNIEHTKPYMHNGVFASLDQVVDFYDGGGGNGRGLVLDNQTLSSDSLHLSQVEKQHLINFMKSLSEKIIFEKAPASLPVSRIKELNNRKVGGIY